MSEASVATGSTPDATPTRTTPVRSGYGPYLATVAMLSLPFLVLFHDWFIRQSRMSANAFEDWGHSFVAPLVSVYLLWQRRDELLAYRPRPFWPGLSVVALGVSCYLYFTVGYSNHMGQGWALLLTLSAVIATVFGAGILRLALAPIGFLVFAVTISEQVMLSVTWPLQLLASQGSWVVLSTLGYTVDISGNRLDVLTPTEVIPLNVAEACSGMRMVIAFLALGAAMALVGAKLWWQRAALFLMAGPVALLINVMRVTFLGVMAAEVDPDFASGDAHMFFGSLWLIPGFFIYLGVLIALQKVVKSDDSGAKTPDGSGAEAPAPSGWRWTWPMVRGGAALSAAVVLAVSAISFETVQGVMGWRLQKEEIHGDQVVANIPRESASWVQVGEDRIEGKETVEVLGTSNYLNRFFKQKNPPEGQDARVVELHLAYYTGTVDTVPHIPERCMVGGGWQRATMTRTLPLELDSSSWRDHPEPPENAQGRVMTAVLSYDYSGSPGKRVLLPFDPESMEMRLNQFTEPTTGTSMFSGYFFIANGGHVAEANRVRELAFRLDTRYAYYLKVQVTCAESETAEELRVLSQSLLSELLPEIMRCVPDWVDVLRDESDARSAKGLRPSVDGRMG